MPVKFNVNTKIKVNGKEYHSLDEMPPDVRQSYERAMATAAGGDRGVLPNLQVRTQSKITFNGQTYNSVDEMPVEMRAIYQSVMSAVDRDHNGIPDQIQGSQDPFPAQAASSPIAPTTAFPDVQQPRSTQSINRRVLLLGILLLTLAILAGLLVFTIGNGGF